MDVVKRIQSVIDDVGVSIFLTSLTSMLAFVLGTFSNIPAVKWLCLYAFPTIAWNFFYQITFFLALVVLDERRIQDNRMDYCTCITVRPKDDDGDHDITHINGNDNNNNNAIIDVDDYIANQINRSTLPPDSNYTDVPAVPEQPRQQPHHEQSVHPADRFMAWYSKQLLRGGFQFTAVLAFVALTAISVDCATQLKQEFDFTKMVPKDSYVKGFYDTLFAHTSQGGENSMAYFRDVDQSDPSIQRQMEAYLDDLIQYGHVHKPTYFWLWDFTDFVQEKTTENSTFADLSFDEQMANFLAVEYYNELYDEDMGIDRDGKVLESRCRIHIDVDNRQSKNMITMMEDLRSISSSQPINEGLDDWKFFTYSHDYHIYE